MVNFIPAPDPRALLPPLLACLPTAFASPRPPPALLELLSPILRQRVHLLSASATSPSESWLTLLCWESDPAQRLPGIVENGSFELHPVSGEIEFGDVGAALYRRLDEETLQAKLDIESLGLIVIYLWCQGGNDAGAGSWRASEIIPVEELATSKSGPWWTTMSEADEKAKEAMFEDALQRGEASENSLKVGVAATGDKSEDDDDDDDDYWNQYNNTPGRTPNTKASPAPNGSSSTTRPRTTSEAEYYAQYAQVQPEMDSDDPSVGREELGESSLNGGAVVGYQSTNHRARDSSHTLDHPKPSSPPSNSITRSEGSAATLSHSEIATRQHISTSMKSLYRLARATGVEKDEFEGLIRRELETLSFMDVDD
ncbi:hypothetical protein MMC20_005690 [Loxospora ochrophaea]|nr:hypothetical protein [Loxospora ochrophaea]